MYLREYYITRSCSQLEFGPIIFDSLPISSMLRHGFSFFSRPYTKFQNSTVKPPLMSHHWDMQGDGVPFKAFGSVKPSNFVSKNSARIYGIS